VNWSRRHDFPTPEKVIVKLKLTAIELQIPYVFAKIKPKGMEMESTMSHLYPR
jgi:hypothetical protein